MAIIKQTTLESLEQLRARAFFFCGVIFIPKMIIAASQIFVGPDFYVALERVFLSIGWTAAFIGLIGFYPSLEDKSRWLVRIGALFALIGGITFTVMAVVSFGYFTNLINGEVSEVLIYFIPGVFGGIVLGFGSFGIASLKTNIYSRGIGLLFLLLPLTFLFNLFFSLFSEFRSFTGIDPDIRSLGVISILMLTMLAIGYFVRTGTESD